MVKRKNALKKYAIVDIWDLFSLGQFDHTNQMKSLTMITISTVLKAVNKTKKMLVRTLLKLMLVQMSFKLTFVKMWFKILKKT
jgi:hypothetical protein